MPQQQREPYRYRGYRHSRPLVQLVRGATCDLVPLQQGDDQNRAGLNTLGLQLAALLEDRVSTLQHYRAQLRYRLYYRGT